MSTHNNLFIFFIAVLTFCKKVYLPQCLFYRIPVPDVFGQRSETCDDTEDNNSLKMSLENNSTNDSEYNYLYDYYHTEYYSAVTSNTTNECNDFKNIDGSVFYENQRNTYKNLYH